MQVELYLSHFECVQKQNQTTLKKIHDSQNNWQRWDSVKTTSC
jgi:hypothetical protein